MLSENRTETSRTRRSGAKRPGRRFDPFRPLSDEERQREYEGYLAHLRARDGELDFSRRLLPVREARQRGLEANPIRWRGELDRDAFYQHFHRVGKPELDAKTLWILTIAVANEGERFGAEGEMRRFDRMGPHRADPIKLYHVVQEAYHTRLLLEACRCLGLDGLTLMKPRWLHRVIIHAMTYLPDSLRYTFILCGEIVGATVFRLMHETCRFFPESPEVEARLRGILDEIVHDEALHVAFCRSRLSRRSLRVARALMPIVISVLMRQLPQLKALGIERDELERRLLGGVEIPHGVDWIAVDTPPAAAPEHAAAFPDPSLPGYAGSLTGQARQSWRKLPIDEISATSPTPRSSTTRPSWPASSTRSGTSSPRPGQPTPGSRGGSSADT